MQEKEQPQPVEGQAENVNLTTIEEDESYYGDALNEVERIDFNFAAEVDGIDNEIALLRQEIKKILAGRAIPQSCAASFRRLTRWNGSSERNTK
jgi:archaellum component FlaC